MLKTLKRKFILINMALVFAVMTAVLAAGLITNQVQFRTDYQLVLQRELSTDDALVSRDFFRMTLTRSDEWEHSTKLAFSAVHKGDGSWLVVPPWIQVDSDALASLCQRALDEHDPSGFWVDSGIAYARKDNRIAFVNLQNEYSQIESSRLAWILIYIGALGVFLLIILLFSRWALRPVEIAWTQQRRFVSDASHELKTPLTVILANLDILEEERGSSPWLTASRSEGLHMKKLIQHLLFLAHSDEAQQKAVNGRVPLSDIVSETALAFEALAFESGLKLNTSIAPGLYTQGDAELLRQLTGILLDNAVKYTPKGGEIDVSLSHQRDQLSLTVRNSNAYIAPDGLERLFDRFYRLDEARVKSEGGYGLGLSIASEIARRHRGTLKASSSKESGTSFTLLIQSIDC
jgi:two-component system sensor histidine kinase CiaH